MGRKGMERNHVTHLTHPHIFTHTHHHIHTHTRSDSQEETDGTRPTVVQQNGDTQTVHSHTQVTKAPKVMTQTEMYWMG